VGDGGLCVLVSSFLALIQPGSGDELDCIRWSVRNWGEMVVRTRENNIIYTREKKKLMPTETNLPY
jgi:hypothetical protein